MAKPGGNMAITRRIAGVNTYRHQWHDNHASWSLKLYGGCTRLSQCKTGMRDTMCVIALYGETYTMCNTNQEPEVMSAYSWRHNSNHSYLSVCVEFLCFH
jgi:hypothetical protein